MANLKPRRARSIPTVAATPSDVLYEVGDTSCDFFVMGEGTVAVLEAHATNTERIVVIHGPGWFIGSSGS
jgi:CRP-like cAMP-binding protein